MGGNEGPGGNWTGEGNRGTGGGASRKRLLSLMEDFARGRAPTGIGALGKWGWEYPRGSCWLTALG